MFGPLPSGNQALLKIGLNENFRTRSLSDLGKNALPPQGKPVPILFAHKGAVPVCDSDETFLP